MDRSRVRVRDRYRVEPVPSALTPRERRARISDFAPEGPGRVTPHPILGWDCGRAGMPTARSTARSTGTVYRTWSYLRYVSHISVWSNSIPPQSTLPKRASHPPKKFKPEFSGLIPDRRLPMFSGPPYARPGMHKHAHTSACTAPSAISARPSRHACVSTCTSRHARLSMCIPACASLGVHVSAVHHARHAWKPAPAAISTGIIARVSRSAESKPRLSSLAASCT